MDSKIAKLALRVSGVEEIWDGALKYKDPDSGIPLEYINDVTYAATSIALDVIRASLNKHVSRKCAQTCVQ